MPARTAERYPCGTSISERDAAEICCRRCGTVAKVAVSADRLTGDTFKADTAIRTGHELSIVCKITRKSQIIIRLIPEFGTGKNRQITQHGKLSTKAC